MPTWRENPLLSHDKEWGKWKGRKRADRVLLPPDVLPRRRPGRVALSLFAITLSGVFVGAFFAEGFGQFGADVALYLEELWEELGELTGAG